MTAYTSLLGLALPVQGTLDGTWGDTVNNSITSLIDEAIAGATEITSDADVTLTATDGSSNQARSAILLMTGARTAVRTITAPAQSKVYIVVNDTTGGYGVKLVGAGPTTGITVANGSKVVVAWNGSDFVQVASSTSTGILGVAYGGTGVSTLTGLVKGNGTSAFTAAVSGTDYAPATSGTAILKGNGSGGFSSAASGTDYAPATSGSSILYGNGSGGFSNVTVGSGLTFSAGTISTDGSAGLGTVTSVGVSVPSFLSVSGSPVTTSGTIALSYSGTALPVANGGTGATTLTGLVKGTGTTAFVAAVSGTDYAPATSGTSILYGDGSGGFSAVTVGSGLDFTAGTLSSTGGTGTVTSVGISVPSFLSVADSPVTSSGTIAISLSGTALPVANGGTGATNLTGIVKANGTSAFSAVTAPSGDLVGTSDTQTLTSKTLQSPTITNGYTEEVYALSGTSVAADPNNASIQTWTLTANSTLTDSLSSGQNVVIGITAGAYNVTWPTMTWTKVGGSGTAPTLYTSGVSWISLWKVGTTLYGSHIGDA